MSARWGAPASPQAPVAGDGEHGSGSPFGRAWLLTQRTPLHRETLGKWRDGGVVLSGLGLDVADALRRVAELVPGMGIEDFVILPNHLHAIILGPETAQPGRAVDAFKRELRRLHPPRSNLAWNRWKRLRVLLTSEDVEQARRFLAANVQHWPVDHPYNDGREPRAFLQALSRFQDRSWRTWWA